MDRRRERKLVFLLASPPFPFHVFHSCALIEAVYHSEFTRAVTAENATDLGIRKARERAATFQYWLDRTGPRVGVLRLQSRSLSVQLLTLKWSPAKGYAKDT